MEYVFVWLTRDEGIPMKHSVQSIIIRVLGNVLKQSGILVAITSLLGHTIKCFRFAASTLHQVIRTRETVLTEHKTSVLSLVPVVQDVTS